MISPNRASGFFSVTVTSMAPVALTLATFANHRLQYAAVFGSLCRSRLNTTSSAVIGLPWANVTPERRVYTYVVGSGVATDWARAGTIVPSGFCRMRLSHRFARTVLPDPVSHV